MLGSLEVASQQLLEISEYNTKFLRIANEQISADFKVVRGAISNPEHQVERTAILGKITQGKTHTTFTPLVPFDQEVFYTVISNSQLAVFEIAKSQAYEPMEVVGIYPGTQQVPANILKWYVQFSRPVNPIKIYDHIHFLDAAGEPIDRSILDLGAPLISADGTLLTVWIEPGRQKRLLGPNRHLGSVFEEDKTYTLQIANTLKDAEGLPMEKSIRHHFRTGEPDRTKPSIVQWQVLQPMADSQQDLSIVCQEQVDYGSLLDAFSLEKGGFPIAGRLRYDSEAGMIHFAPKSNWSKGEYSIKVEGILEDLAGNNLRYLFDRPIDESQAERTPQELLFVIE